MKQHLAHSTVCKTLAGPPGLPYTLHVNHDLLLY